MSVFTKRGSAAVTSATTTNDAKESVIVPFGSGKTYKVRVKSAEDSVEYYAYGMYERVNTFVPKDPAERNAKGYVTANPSVWDRAEQYLRDQSRKAKDAGDDKTAEALWNQAYLYAGKPRYLIAFGNLADGKDIVIDVSKKQATAIFAAMSKYAKKLDKIAFELSKVGTGTSTTVSLSPILDMDEDLTPDERKNFDSCGEKPFDFELFEACLYVSDTAEQTKNLVVAGFDIGTIGLSYGGDTGSSDAKSTDAKPIDTSKPAGDVGF